MRLLLATKNEGKLNELCALLSQVKGITLVTFHERSSLEAVLMPVLHE